VTKVVADSPHSGRTFVSLRGRDAFQRVYRSERRHRRGDVVVITADGASGPPQVGFVAGKRIGSAVERNRVKRRLREAMDRVSLDDDTAYIVIAGPGVATADFRRVVGWLEAAVAAGREAKEQE
jgi:ribonuclease P protein component